MRSLIRKHLSFYSCFSVNSPEFRLRWKRYACAHKGLIPQLRRGSWSAGTEVPTVHFTKTHMLSPEGCASSGVPRGPGPAAEAWGKACHPRCSNPVWSGVAVEELGLFLRPASGARLWFHCFSYCLICRDADGAPMSSEGHWPLLRKAHGVSPEAPALSSG